MIVNDALGLLEREFAALYSRLGVAPDGATGYDLLFRWLVCIGADDAAWDHSTFSNHRDRLLKGDIATKRPSTGAASSGLTGLLRTVSKELVQRFSAGPTVADGLPRSLCAALPAHSASGDRLRFTS